MNNDLDELNENEKMQFKELPRGKTPPAFMEENIVNMLKKENFIDSGVKQASPRIFRLAITFATSILILAFGVGIGIWWNSDGAALADNETPQFILLLRSTAAQTKNISNEEEKQRISEYRAWAGEIQKNGFLLQGEKLTRKIEILDKTPGDAYDEEKGSGASLVVGYFVIKAKDYGQAVLVAKRCPHLKYGGKIEVREIERFQ